MYCMYFNSVSVIDLSWVHRNKGQKNVLLPFSSCSFFCLFFFLVLLLKFLSPSARQKIQSKKDERHQTWKPTTQHKEY